MKKTFFISISIFLQLCYSNFMINASSVNAQQELFYNQINPLIGNFWTGSSLRGNRYSFQTPFQNFSELLPNESRPEIIIKNSLKEKLLNILSKAQTSTNITIDKYCPICLHTPETLETDQTPTWYILECNHTFCHDDLLKFIKSNERLKCPFCKKDITENSIKKLL
jgi:hypothetical protein